MYNSTNPLEIKKIRKPNLVSGKEDLNNRLTTIFLTCMNRKFSSQIWNKSQFTPVYKDCKKADTKLYRRFSLLCCCSKRFEKVVFDELFCRFRDLLHDSRLGFSKQKPPRVQQLLFLDKVQELYDQQKVRKLSALYLDFTNAFDSIVHDILFLDTGKIGFGVSFMLVNWMVNCKSDQPKKTWASWNICITSRVKN